LRIPIIGRRQKSQPSIQLVTSWDVDPEALVSAHNREDLTFGVLMGIAARSGREEGLQAGLGRISRDRLEDLPARKLLMEKVGERKKIIERSANVALQQIRSQVLGLEARAEAAKGRHAHTHLIEGKERSRLEDHEQSIHESENPHPPSRFDLGYWFLLMVLALVELPTIYQSLQGSFIEKWAIYIISGALSIIVAICAHTVGANLAKFIEESRLVKSAGSGEAGKSSDIESLKVDKNVHLLIVIAITGMIGALMIAVFETRTALFQAILERRAKSGLPTNNFNVELLSAMFFVLQVLLFVLATAVSFNRSKHEDERHDAKQRRKRKRELENEEKKAERKAKGDAERLDEVITGLELARNSSTLIEGNLQSRLDQEEHFLQALLAEHDLAFEVGRREAPTTVPPNPALFEATPSSEFRDIEV